MPWTDPDLNDWAAGQVVTAALMDTYVKDNLSWLGQDRTHGRGSGSYSHTSSGNWKTPTWSNVSTSPNVTVGSCLTTSTGYFNPNNRSGFYLVGAAATFAANATGARGIMLSSSSDGGGTVYAQNFAPSQTVAVGAAVVTGLQLAANSAVYVSLFQGSGGTLSISNISVWGVWITT